MCQMDFSISDFLCWFYILLECTIRIAMADTVWKAGNAFKCVMTPQSEHECKVGKHKKNAHRK